MGDGDAESSAKTGDWNLKALEAHEELTSPLRHHAEQKDFARIGVEMSGKYAFTKTLKELRFLHCQTSEHSNAVR